MSEEAVNYDLSSLLKQAERLECIKKYLQYCKCPSMEVIRTIAGLETNEREE